MFRLSKPAILLLLACATAAAQTISEDGTKLLRGNRVLLDSNKDGFMAVHQVRPSPDGKRFAVIACGYECTDNVGFLFNADGGGKRQFTMRWDFLLQDVLEWSADGKKLFYYRINSTAAEPPKTAPAEGWVEIDLATGRKAAAASRTLKPNASYAVFNVRMDDSLNVREAPSLKANIAGKLPYDAANIKFTGDAQKTGKETWVKIKFDSLVGWVNQNYIYEKAK
ncbi:MAG TPA: SH3 domain-containing protein [Blastocatellia bacterium]|nr:SH3 domain-containing protein [Blastocatellia bacterium]HMX30351.1 SH3 domain-containing protein [Blastocatellia bacterium]HMZ17049.1 SH3 domain-containing protein [Blastocatellia bacterium]HNG34008.1 SH3 domain-containing protein [Blastocatellia bacterium]